MNKVDNIGRPKITDDEIKQMVSKVEPFLRSGLSVRKALSQARVPRATFYRLLDSNSDFRDQIDLFRQFVSVMTNNVIVTEIMRISKKQNEGKVLDKNDLKTLFWFASHSKLTQEEYGERTEITSYDPEVEIQRLTSMINEVSDRSRQN